MEIITDWNHDGGRVIAIAAHGSILPAPLLKLGDDDWDLEMSNLAFIARACNAHDALVAALNAALKDMTEIRCQLYGNSIEGPVQAKMRAALKLAQ